LRWLVPCVPEGPLAAEIVLREGLKFELSSGGIVHVSGWLEELADPAPAALPGADPAGPAMEADAVYARFAALGLDYGAGFRSIRSLRLGADRSVADLVCPPGHWAGTALPPGLLDGVLQAAAMVVFAQPDATRLLPMSVDRIAVLGPMPARGTVQTRLTTGEARDFAQFDAVLRNEAGEIVLTVEGLAGRIDRSAVVAPAATVPEGWFYAPHWSSAPAAPSPVSCETVLVMTPGEPLSVPSGARVIQLGRALDWNRELGAGVGRLVWAMPSAPEQGETATLELFRALKAMRAARGFAAARVVVAGLAGAADVAVAWAAAARALARVAEREWSDWSVVPATLDAWSALPAAMDDAGHETGLELRWQDGQRQARVLRPAPLPPGTPAFREGGAYLIVGGGGGIGQALALRVARSHRARFALVGRHPATAAQEAVMAQIRAAGGDAVHLIADATRPEDMAQAVATARARFGALHGAIHAAIVMEDRSLEMMTEDVFRRGLDVKTRGMLALADAVAGCELDWLAVFSSVNAFVANAGQANYVAGCAFKDAYALALRARGVPVRVIDWGFWGEAGRVADDAYRQRLTRKGVLPITTDEGLVIRRAPANRGVEGRRRGPRKPGRAGRRHADPARRCRGAVHG
jgi:polyketide synthase PksM/rhizoxin synthesis polyketide synthase/nonribosomal peptide synthetase RhiB